MNGKAHAACNLNYIYTYSKIKDFWKSQSVTYTVNRRRCQMELLLLQTT